MTNLPEAIPFKKKEIKEEIIQHFSNLLGMGEETSLQETWYESMTSLVKTANIPVPDFCRFLTWVVEENTSDIGGMNSVEYIAMAKDKMGSLAKNFDTLWRTYNAKLKVATVKRRVTTAPLSLKIAGWLMDGPGVNEPPTGWSSARQKLDAIKRSWYGIGWESQPDPAIPWEEKFEQYKRTFRIIGDEDEV